jgi:hypothetical protein
LPPGAAETARRAISVPIEDYGIIGNARRGAGVARRIDRLALPAAL